ncbi:Metallo-dependent phosphatase-like protein [Rhodotorula diobovata]|uniref:Vacuolar protein sorting-associated protein 29 n=1 Tax=Rhodotorula diobovata TaxID=5288 RepID=A0A5C5FWJ7_9BASI|nr:Metallo-dependent phosphatase-like protein [Rhodotorula diobovata]
MLVLVIGDLHIPNRAHDLPAKFKKLLVPGKIGQILSTGNITDRETWEYLRSVAPDLRGVRGDCDEVRLSPSASLPPSMVVQHGPLRIGVIHGHQVVPLGDAEMLGATARKLDVDVLISGGTHRFEAFEAQGRFFLNPGSATGAFSPLWTPAPVPAAPAPGAAGGAAAAAGGEAAAQGEEGSKKEAVEGAKDGKACGGDGDAVKEDEQEEEDEEEEGPTPSFALLDIQGNVVVTYVYQEKRGDVSVEKLEFRRAGV